MTRRSIILVLALSVAGGFGVAGDAQAGVDGRQPRQQARIAEGVRSGDLTRREATRLEAQQARIRREERRYRADGVLGPWERADLRRDQRRASRTIRRQKNDGQSR
jgi:hypothetical protein